MDDTQETIADIIAEMRRRSDEAYKGSFNYAECQENQIEYDEASEWADRFEAAHRRERGDCAKLREALDESRRIASDLGGCRLNDYWKLNEIVRVCEAALSAPPRNCDVGTAQEQDERFHRFCVKHHTGSCAGCHNPVGDYTVANGVRECALVWAQMPYEGGDK